MTKPEPQWRDYMPLTPAKPKSLEQLDGIGEHLANLEKRRRERDAGDVRRNYNPLKGTP